MVDLLNQASELTGIGQGAGGGVDVTLVITFFLVAVFFLVAFSVGVWFFVRWLQYKYKIEIYEKINGRFQRTYIRKARRIPVGKGGDEAFLLNKPKMILPTPTIQSGKNTYLFFISEDGEWINFQFSDFDDDRRAVGSQFLDKEMRYARTSLQHLGDERYNKKNFWQEHGAMIMFTGMIIIVMIGFWMMIDKMIEFQGVSNSVMASTDQVLTKLNEILASTDNIATGGSGLVEG